MYLVQYSQDGAIVVALFLADFWANYDWCEMMSVLLIWWGVMVVMILMIVMIHFDLIWVTIVMIRWVDNFRKIYFVIHSTWAASPFLFIEDRFKELHFYSTSLPAGCKTQEKLELNDKKGPNISCLYNVFIRFYEDVSTDSAPSVSLGLTKIPFVNIPRTLTSYSITQVLSTFSRRFHLRHATMPCSGLQYSNDYEFVTIVILLPVDKQVQLALKCSHRVSDWKVPGLQPITTILMMSCWREHTTTYCVLVQQYVVLIIISWNKL